MRMKATTLRQVRRSRDLTQAQLAQLTGLRQTTISDIESGRNRNPSWEFVRRISAALEMDPRELFPGRQSEAA